jgi:hypothetical protein
MSDVGHRRAQCQVCLHSVRVSDDGTVVPHADPRYGRSGQCPGSGHPGIGNGTAS